MAARVSQIVVETQATANPNARTSQQVIEALSEVQAGATNARVSQEVVENLTYVAPGSTQARISQEVVENLVRTSREARITQLIIEVLAKRIPFMIPPVYPELIGLGFDVKWSPQFYNMPTATSATGADIDLALATTPLHDFELTYNFLRDRFIAGTQEFKTMFGFFLRMQGTVGRFLFRNKDDRYTTNEPIATTDGVASLFYPLQRTFGVGENVGTESIGWIDRTQQINIYMDGVLQDPSTYDILEIGGCDMQLKIHSTPTAGISITGDYGYFYYCKFPDNQNTFNKFMEQLWALQTVKLHSCRAGA